MKHNTFGMAALACAACLLLPGVRTFAQQPTASQSVDPHANETKAQRDARMHWWREARFGMFIHWGLYSVPAGSYHGQRTGGLGEWMMHDDRIPVGEYASYAQQFDPEQFNADTIVGIAKAAGMKYIVITAKHHEGFAMFHTSVDKFNIYDATKFKRDPIAEMAAACKKQGIKFGVYYSQNLDWHHPGGGTAGASWDPAQQGDLADYVKNVSAPQVKELITKYKPAVLWWDINGPFTPDEARALTSSFSQDPGLIYNNRMGGGVPGDTETPEQHIPPTGYPGKDWETCMTINNTWGYKTFDTNFKSTQTLLTNLIDIASKGGNYLLNVGPDSNGVVPQPEVDRLKAMGAWLKVNGESIYATSPSPYKKLPFSGRATVKGNALYLNVFSWPDSGLTLTGLLTSVTSATAIADGQQLQVSKAADGTLTISKPSNIDPISTAIKLTLGGPPVVVEAPSYIAAQADGSYKLGAGDADLGDGGAQVEGSSDDPDIGYWTSLGDTASWSIKTLAGQSGQYKANLVYACDPGSDGSTFSVQVDGVDSGMTAAIVKTTGWGDYQTMTLVGNLNLTPGTHIVRVKPVTMPGQAVMNLRTITLVPAK